MRNRLYFFALWLTLVSLVGCSLEDPENFQFVALPITAVEMPESFELNATYEIKVSYQRTSSCAFFERFDVPRQESTTRMVSVIGRMLSDRDNCQEILEEVETSFNFMVLYNEPYLFRFYAGLDENDEAQFIEIEVPVN